MRTLTGRGALSILNPADDKVDSTRSTLEDQATRSSSSDPHAGFCTLAFTAAQVGRAQYVRAGEDVKDSQMAEQARQHRKEEAKSRAAR